MARYDHLPIYKSIYDLNLYFFKLARGFRKDYKYGLAREIESLLTKLIDQVVKANNNQDKTEELKDGLITIERIKLKTRLLHDLKVIKITSYEFFSKQLVEVSTQFENWLNWSKAH
jgi:hypothetical protein